jgi:hypothetical protein
MFVDLHVKILVKLSSLGTFSENTHISNLTKIRPVKAKLFYVDGLTDRQKNTTKLILAIRNFSMAPKTSQMLLSDCTCYNETAFDVSA